MRLLFLIGPRGSGKSSVAAALARQSGCSFLDTDALVEQGAGKPIPRIIAEHGWEVFRRYESAALREAVAVFSASGDTFCKDDLCGGIIATGGGIVLDATNRECIRQAGICVYLNAPAEILLGRLRKVGQERPALSGLCLEDEVRAILRERDPLYRETASHMEDASLPVETIITRLLPLCMLKKGDV